MKAKYALFLSLILMFTPPVFASEESHREAAKQMVEVANLDKMLNAMYEQINGVIIQNLLTRDPCLESIRKPLTDLLTRYDEKILNAQVVKEEIQKVYVQEFTEEEIHSIVAFYKTPAGQKALEKAPLLAAKGMEIAQKEMDKSKQKGVMTDLQHEITKLIDTIDPKQLSPECQKQFEDRKAKKAAQEAATDKTTNDKAQDKKTAEKAK